MDINGLVASYQTFYGGDPNRIHNVQLVSHLVDKHVIAPGETFSFNGATGARTQDKGFVEAPVIINGELKTGLGGGVCQVSTTVFNAAYEAGPADRFAHEPRAVHQPLSAGPRRDRQLSGHRSEVHERHRPLAPAAYLGRVLVAHGRAVRNAAPPPGRQRNVAARGDRAAAGHEDQGSVAPRRADRGRGERVAVPQDEQ